MSRISAARLEGYIRGAGPFLALACVTAIFALADALQADGGAFLSLRSLRVILVQASTVAVAALGMTVIIAAGGIDLAAGTALSLSATVLAACLQAGAPAGAGVAASVLTGLVCGLINGLLVSGLGLLPFIATLGTMTAFLGTAKILAGETAVRPRPESVPDWLDGLVSTRAEAQWLGLAPGVWLAVALALLLALVLRRSVFGRHVFALGSNERAARLCGVQVRLVKTLVYTIGGLFAGIAGVYQFSRLAVGNPTSGVGMELRVIAAVVVGGGSLSGGQGSVLGTLVGAMLMSVISSGCNAIHISNPVQDLVLGGVIVAAVLIDVWRRRQPSGS